MCLGAEVFGKPVDREAGIVMLLQLAGRAHEVLTSVAVVQGERVKTCVNRSQLRFRDIRLKEAQAYWETGEPADKAGGYAIQGVGGIFVAELQGSYSGVVGLPLYETALLLREFGITVLGQ